MLGENVNVKLMVNGFQLLICSFLRKLPENSENLHCITVYICSLFKK